MRNGGKLCFGGTIRAGNYTEHVVFGGNCIGPVFWRVKYANELHIWVNWFVSRLTVPSASIPGKTISFPPGPASFCRVPAGVFYRSVSTGVTASIIVELLIIFSRPWVHYRPVCGVPLAVHRTG